jgi:hypothetical protein
MSRLPGERLLDRDFVQATLSGDWSLTGFGRDPAKIRSHDSANEKGVRSGNRALWRFRAHAVRGFRRCADGRGHASGETGWPRQLDAGTLELPATLQPCSATYNESYRRGGIRQAMTHEPPRDPGFAETIRMWR